MQTAPLACPHCGSILSFGVEIAAGSSVECLICMRSFVAQATVAPAVAATTTNGADCGKSAVHRSIDTAPMPTLSDADTDTKSIPPTNSSAKAKKLPWAKPAAATNQAIHPVAKAPDRK